MPENKFDFESLQDCESIKGYLEALVKGIENKRIIFSTEQKEIVLNPNGLMKLTIKAKKKEAKNRISIKLAWTEERKKLSAQNMAISSV